MKKQIFFKHVNLVLQTLLIVLNFAQASEEPCSITMHDSFTTLLSLSQSLPQIIGLTATQNVEDFCAVNAFRDFDYNAGFTPNDEKDKRIQDTEIWHANFVASSKLRENSFLSRLSAGETSYLVLSKETSEMPQAAYEAIIEKLNHYPNQISPSDVAAFNDALKNFKNIVPDQQDQTKSVGYSQAVYLCSDLGIIQSSSCAKGVQNIAEKAKPRNGVLFENIWGEVVNDPIYMKVFKQVALKIISVLKSGKSPETRLFEDFKSEFLKEIKNSKLADEYTWKTMAILSSGGANAHVRTIKIGHEIADFNDLVYLISNGSLVLDRTSAQQGFLYTWPKDVKNTCDTGKNYHFWMTAYLARETAKLTGNMSASAAAAFTVQKGYQFMKEGHGRDPSSPFKIDALDNYTNNIRISLTLAAAGAWYGASSLNDTNTSLSKSDVDNGIRKTFQGIKILPKRKITLEEFRSSTTNPVELISLYADWKKIVNPDAAFSTFKDKYLNH